VLQEKIDSFSFCTFFLNADPKKNDGLPILRFIFHAHRPRYVFMTIVHRCLLSWFRERRFIPPQEAAPVFTPVYSRHLCDICFIATLFWVS
jgi:hypothetical protein